MLMRCDCAGDDVQEVQGLSDPKHFFQYVDAFLLFADAMHLKPEADWQLIRELMWSIAFEACLPSDHLNWRILKYLHTDWKRSEYPEQRSATPNIYRIAQHLWDVSRSSYNFKTLAHPGTLQVANKWLSRHKGRL